MLRNYIITALRSLKRNKVYAFLNVFGLALGIGCALVIYKVISYEISFDKHHEHYASIYRVVTEDIYPDRVDKGEGTPHPVGPALKADFPELKHVTRTNYMYGAQLNVKNRQGDLQKFLMEEGIAFVEPSFFDIFTVRWIAGDPARALTEPNTVVITRSIAQRLFGLNAGEEETAISKLINYNNVKDFKVTGIIEDPEIATSLPFKLLMEYGGQDHPEINPYYSGGTSWRSTSSNTHTYFLATDGFDRAGFNEKLLGFVEKYHGEGKFRDRNYVAQPFSEIHFDEDYGSYTSTTSLQFLYALGIIGIFLVITACINFVNLATAQAANRSKEIGIRKAIGSAGSQLIIQFMAEIAMISFIALIISLAICELMLNMLKDIIGAQLSIDLFGSPHTLLFLIILFIIVSFLSGFYPAVLLSRMNAVLALKNKITARNHSGGFSLRKGLVVVQFTISQFLIIGVLIVSAQTNFLLNKELGFDTKAIFSTYLPDRDDVKRERFRQEMLTSSAIENVTFSLSEPTGNNQSHSSFNYAPLESEKDYHGNFKPVDEAYIQLFNINLLAGRSIQKGDSHNVVINRMVADLMGFENNYEGALGQTLTTGWDGDKKVVGVTDNFHTYSLDRGLDYTLLLYYPSTFYSIAFKAASMDQVEEAKAHFEKTWELVYPEYVIDYDFYDQTLAQRYESTQNITTLMKTFAGISIIIGCLGLYGLISFIAINKTKEIGVRKVLGASVMNILTMFSKEIIVLMSIAFVITTPVAFYLLSRWLDNFAFQIAIGPQFFLIAFAVTLLIAFVTISHKTITSASLNPAQTLKDD